MMSLWHKPDSETDNSDIYNNLTDDIEDLGKLVKDQNSLIKELMAEIKALKLEVTELSLRTKEAIRKDEELHEAKSEVKNMMTYIQECFTSVLAKKIAPNSHESEAVRDYKNKKLTRLPLPG